MKQLLQKAYVNKSSVHGWGGFAKKAIKKGGIIEECPYIVSTAEKKHPEEILRYLFTGQKKNTTMVVLGYGAVYNHAKHNNAAYFFDDEKDVIVFIAKRKIKKGEEIFVNYGGKYWASRKKKPK
jgi:SET domain-containing protein